MAKTGGRQVGTLNKRTKEVIDRLEALRCDPIEGMAKIALDEKNPVELRGRMFAELAQYVAPKRKAIEHSGEVETNYVARMPGISKDMDSWQAEHAHNLKPTVQ